MVLPAYLNHSVPYTKTILVHNNVEFTHAEAQMCFLLFPKGAKKKEKESGVAALCRKEKEKQRVAKLGIGALVKWNRRVKKQKKNPT